MAQTSFTTLYDFTGKNGDGASPLGDLVMDANGVLYGATNPGGRQPQLYSLTPPTFATGSWTKTVLLRAPGTTLTPVVLGKQGELYGAAGSGSLGFVYQLMPPVSPGGAWTLNTLHAFQGAAQGDGSMPALGQLAMDANGNLYGVTQSGGFAGSHIGTIYELSPPATPGGAWTYQLIYKFQRVRGGYYGPQVGVTIDKNGVLYGSTRFAEDNKGNVAHGVIYQLTPPTIAGGAWSFNVINNSIGGTDLLNGPSQLTVGPDGTLYGVASLAGGAFMLAPPALPGGTWTLTTLPTEMSSGPFGPEGGPGWELALDANGTLYGTDVNGQLLYRIVPPTPTVGVWYWELVRPLQLGSSGDQPFGRPLLDASGNIFGTTRAGGSGAACLTGGGFPLGCGTVYELQ